MDSPYPLPSFNRLSVC